MSLDAANLAARCLVHPIIMKTGYGYRGPHTARCRTHLALRNRYTKLYDAAQTEMPAVGRLRAFGLERILNEWTIDYYFDYLGHDVIYRQTPEGPEVLAVGYEEEIRLRKTMPLEEQLKLKTWMW